MTIGAKILFNSLINHGVKTVFGYPGGAILPVLNEFHEQNKIKYIMSRTELGGSFMAEGYSKITGKPGVIMVTSGPGALNTITSLQNALSDGTPTMVLSGQVATTVLGTDAFQEADVINISKNCTKWNNQITNGNLISQTVDNAFTQMLNQRYGPVLLDLPKNIMSTNYNEQIKTNFSIKNEKRSTITVSEITDLILKSKKPVILAGQGIFQNNSVELLRKIANSYNIPVTTTLMGLGVFDEKNPLSLKMLGMHGSFAANKAVQNCDLLLNFGSRFDDRIIGDPSKFAPKAKIVHVDILYKNINKTIKTKNYINDDCKNVLRDMTKNKRFPYLFCNKSFNDWHLEINNWKKTGFSYPEVPLVLQGRHVIATLNKIIHLNTINNFTIVADVGAHQMWAAQFIDYNYPKIKFITSGGLGSMGFALPASIGAKIGKPTEKVICICGDGGFTMSMTEILTAVDNKINIKVLIINNSYQLMVKMWQEKFYNGNIIGTKMNNPSFEKVCESLGCHAIRITHNDDLEKCLEYILSYEDGPIVANIITSENEPVLPMVCPGKAIDEMILDENNHEQIKGDAPC